jgi:hypothetical protein
MSMETDLDSGGGRVTPGEERSREGGHRFGYVYVFVCVYDIRVSG